MPDFFLELFSEEIPARMQAPAARELAERVGEALAALTPGDVRGYHGPRRIAVVAEVAAAVPASDRVERGPRVAAPDQALAGFLRKHGAAKDQLSREGDYWVLTLSSPATDAATLISRVLPGLLRGFPWPKSMRWGGTSGFVWVRPLRRICALLDGTVVPFDLREGDDDGHGLAAGDLSEGHRFMAPGAFTVTSETQWKRELERRYVLADATERRGKISDGLGALAATLELRLVDDPGLLDEVTNLVEWPVPLLGRIDDDYMDLPPEVMQVSMRVNQRYFALRDLDGAAAPFFGFVANIEAIDGGTAIIAGNERVLRARFADARYFWDLDRQTRLADRVAALDAITFHARLGSQGDRVRRLVRCASVVGEAIGADPVHSARAALLAKADLTTGMVGEFPELQGIMGGYYARHDGEADAVAEAVRDHYAPRGVSDPAPTERVAMAVALADKLDQLAAFFSIGERPTGSGDPFALRRAALGILRIIRDRGLRVALRPLISSALGAVPQAADNLEPLTEELFGFLIERLRVQMRAEGARYDILNAVFAAGSDDDLTRLLARGDAVARLLDQPDGRDLLAAYRRAANILRIEDRKDGPHVGPPEASLFVAAEERALGAALDVVELDIDSAISREDFAAAMVAMAGLRVPLDGFFDKVTVNVEVADLRRNRLRLLRRITRCMDRVADFSKIDS